MAAVLLAALLLPGVSRADCGGVKAVSAAHHRLGQRPPLAIGDSTMLLSLPGLSARGFAANAHGCRQFAEATQLLSQLRARRALPHMVVIALGANGAITHGDIATALGILCCTRKLVLVTPRQLGGAAGENAVVEHQEARKHPRKILLLDWVKYSSGHPSWFQPDGLHLTLPGVAAFNRLLATALPYAYPPRGGQWSLPPRRRAGRERATRNSIQPSGQGLGLTASLAHAGYVGVTITAPAGTSVQLSEQRAATTTPIGVFDIPASGMATVPHALTWLCDQRTRLLVASTLPPVLAAAATATVTTPSCAKRLATKIDRRARVGRAITITLRDRWGLGGLPLTVCVTPPGGRRHCAPWQLRRGQDRRVVRIPVPRPGGWRTTLRTRYGFSRHRLVWASHRGGRSRPLAAGDSQMQILDGFIAGDLARYGVNVTSDARISTGLTNPSLFNWPNHARRQAQTLRPDVTVFFIGANDGFTVADANGQSVNCCSAAWSAGYANLVSEMMRSYLRGNSGRVYWFLLPAPRPANFKLVFDAVNAGIRAAARRFPGRVALIDANAFFTPGDRYRDHMVYRGHGFVIHEPDGIHLSTAADTIDAAMVTRRLLADRVLR